MTAMVTEHEECAGDRAERSPQILAQQPEARQLRVDLGRPELDDVRVGGYGSPFGLRMVVAMSMTTFTTTTMIVK